MDNSGWIKLHRSILQWDWWDDQNTTRLFLYLILAVNHKDKKWHGRIIPRGSLVTSRAHLSEETGISPQSLRTSLDRLKSTSEITSESTNGFTLISICNYDKYQDQSTSESTSDLTNDQPATNKRSTTTKECKNVRIKEISTKVDTGTPEVYGNPEINKLLVAIKAKVGISDFSDSQKWQRIYGKHCQSLLEKIGSKEFARRLDIIMNDSFKHKRCNEIKFIYDQVKGFIEPISNPIII